VKGSGRNHIGFRVVCEGKWKVKAKDEDEDITNSK